jgi:hypothetical protein
MPKETHIDPMYLRQKVTTHPAIGLASDYIWENFRTATRKEKQDVRKKIPNKTSELSEFPNIIPALTANRFKN